MKKPEPDAELTDCPCCGSEIDSSAGKMYCFSVYLYDPTLDKSDNVRPPDGIIHARNMREARRTLLEEGNDGFVSSPGGGGELWPWHTPRKRLPAHIEICYT